MGLRKDERERSGGVEEQIEKACLCLFWKSRTIRKLTVDHLDLT